MILYLRVYIYILFKGGLCSKGKQLFFRVKASLWHVRASYLLFCCEEGQVPVGKGKHDLNADSYKTGETQSDSDNRPWEPKQRRVTLGPESASGHWWKEAIISLAAGREA